MSKVNQVAQFLRDADVVVKKIMVSNDPQVEDDAIILTNGYHVSVGADYMSLVKEENDGTFTFFEVDDPNKAVETIKKLIKIRCDSSNRFYVEVPQVVHGQEIMVKRYGDLTKRPKQYVR